MADDLNKRAVFVVGHPGGHSWTVSDGKLTKVRSVKEVVELILPEHKTRISHVVQEKDCLQLDVTADFGSSGGPVFTKDLKKVLGFVWLANRPEGDKRIVYCVPSNWLNDVPFDKPEQFIIPEEFNQG